MNRESSLIHGYLCLRSLGYHHVVRCFPSSSHYRDHFGSWWSILVHFGTHHGWPHHPSMTGSDSYPLSSAHFIQKRVILVTQENSKHFCTAMLYWPFGSNLSHFGPFWCTSWVTPPPSMTGSDSYPLSSVHSIQKWITLVTEHQFKIIFSWSCYSDHFGPFWSILVHPMGDPMTPLHRISIKSSKICILSIKSF